MEVIVGPSSPFRSLPVDMPRRQILFFDGLRICAEMADIAFCQLVELLDRIEKSGDSQSSTHFCIPTMLSAYSFIDSLHRFRIILPQAPRLKHETGYKLFLRQTKQVKELRNILQHLDGHIDAIVRNGLAALGTLSWLGSPTVEGGPPTCFVLQAGTIYFQQVTAGDVVNLERRYGDGISQISLRADDCKLELCSLRESLRLYFRSLEKGLLVHLEDKQLFGSDLFVRLNLVPQDEHEKRTPPG